LLRGLKIFKGKGRYLKFGGIMRKFCVYGKGGIGKYSE